MFPVSVSLLFLSLVEVYSLTVTPHLSFLEINLTNHSYVKFLDVDWFSRVLCHSNLPNCCSRGLRGDWIFPNGTTLKQSYLYGVFQKRTTRKVELSRSSWITTPPNGLYQCKIAVDSNKPSLKQSIYVGLYTNNKSKLIFH